MLPSFNSDGLLPVGDYPLTLDQLMCSFLVEGGPSLPGWDIAWRAKLVRNLKIMVEQLWSVGISEIFIDGSFVEDKNKPNDIDGYFVCERTRLQSGELVDSLNEMDPFKVWGWSPQSRTAVRGSIKRQLPMWHQYRVELYPHVGQMTGIKDKYGNDLTFPSAFRKSRREDLLKGIIKINR